MDKAEFDLLEAQYQPIRIKMERGMVLSKREHKVALQYNAALDKMADGSLTLAKTEPDLDLNFGVKPHDIAPGDFSGGIHGINDELGFVEPPDTLTMAERRFILAYAQAIPTRDAYLATINPPEPIDNETMWEHIRALFLKPGAKEYLEELNRRVEDVAVASKRQVELYLTAAMEATLETTGTDSPLCRKAIVRRSYDKEGNVVGQTLERQLVDPLAAAKMLASIRGYDQPQKIEVDHKGGVMVVPMTKNDEEWIKHAETEQQKLIEETIDV